MNMHRSIASEFTDSDNSPINPSVNMTMTAKVAHVEQVSASKPPFLTAGKITPEALCAWEMGCIQFFLHKEDLVVQDWYLNNQAKFDKMSFKDYLAETWSIANSWHLPKGSVLSVNGLLRSKGKIPSCAEPHPT
ncbi:hypothetical protein BDR04DRAFT_1112561 [Suillus decipiens]|nr:hypothetical protein BDR04DRAFT_1112561 [Suillus decipiens]